MIFQQNKFGIQTPSQETPVLVLLCGFPDNSDSWSRLIPSFEKTHHIIALNLPDYEKSNLSPGHFWGYTFHEIIAGLAIVMEPYYTNKHPIHLVGHDWGSFFCQLYTLHFEDRVTKLILLDGGKMDETGNRINAWLRFIYASWLAFCFLVSRISTVLSYLCIGLFPWFLIGPTYETNVPFTYKTIKPFMCYPYFQTFVFRFQHPNQFKPIPYAYASNVPQLFLYGKQKRLYGHARSYIEFLKQQEECGYKEFESDGHWLHWSNPESVAKEIHLFLQR